MKDLGDPSSRWAPYAGNNRAAGTIRASSGKVGALALSPPQLSRA
jgi:hypothetical protein